MLFPQAFAADKVKTVRFSLLIAETTFDPAKASDLYSNMINEAIFEAPLTYDFLARPAKLIPNTTVAMPEVTDAGKTYTFKFKPGIYFADDPAFKGQKRELAAADYAYAIKRLYDPKLSSPWLWYIEGKIVGGDEALAAAKKAGKLDYDAPIAGIETPDKYTLRIRLKETDYNFLYIFGTVQTGAVAREVIEANAADPGAHPIGTGPFRLAEWKRSHNIVLEANPSFRTLLYDADPGADPEMQEIYKQMKGKKLPQIQRVDISVIEESQPRWLAFINGETDYANAPNEFAGFAFPGGKLAPNLAKLGMRGQRFVEPDVVYTYFNMEHPVVGGYAPERVALRRAMSMGSNVMEEINVIRNGGAIKAESPIPPGVAGYDPAFRNPFGEYSPAKANALLDMYGYIDRDGDGYRENPDGSQLVVEQSSDPSANTKQYDELWRKNMDAIGIKLVWNKAKWPDLNKQSLLGKLVMWQQAWSADYPDAENFYQNLYGPNAGESNRAKFKLPAFDKLYEQARLLPPSPERSKLYAEMARLVSVYTPWIPNVHRLRSDVLQPWIIGYKKHPILTAPWLYLDIDESKRP
ncbi:MAG: ABC transporter substrate-binding protein [Usitatibacteraceae bacterium]